MALELVVVNDWLVEPNCTKLRNKKVPELNPKFPTVIIWPEVSVEPPALEPKCTPPPFMLLTTMLSLNVALFGLLLATNNTAELKVGVLLNLARPTKTLPELLLAIDIKFEPKLLNTDVELNWSLFPFAV